jgi:hypothetical protein
MDLRALKGIINKTFKWLFLRIRQERTVQGGSQAYGLSAWLGMMYHLLEQAIVQEE